MSNFLEGSQCYPDQVCNADGMPERQFRWSDSVGQAADDAKPKGTVMTSDTRCFEAFAAAQSPALMGTAVALTSDFHAAQDLVQDTLARMFEQWDRVSNDAIETPAAYAHVVLVRRFISLRRRRSFWERPVQALPDRAGTVDDPVLRVAIADALARLKPKDRAVLVLRYLCDRSVDQVAADLGRSPGAVRSQSKRALERLRAGLGHDALLDLT